MCSSYRQLNIDLCKGSCYCTPAALPVKPFPTKRSNREPILKLLYGLTVDMINVLISVINCNLAPEEPPTASYTWLSGDGNTHQYASSYEEPEAPRIMNDQLCLDIQNRTKYTLVHGKATTCYD